MNIQPLADRVLIKPAAAEEKIGGIIIPDTAKEKPSRGRVLAIGDGAVLENGERQPMCLKVGDVVLFSKWGGTEIKLDGKDRLIMKETDVLGIIEE